MNKKLGIMLFLMAVVCGVFQFGNAKCLAAQKEKIVFTNVEKNKLDLYKGEKKRIRIDYSYLRKNRKIKWTSANKRVITVNQKGLLKAKRCGKTKIIVQVKNTKIKAVVKVKVAKLKKAKKIQITSKKDYILTGEQLILEARLKPSKSNDGIIWESSNDDIASIDENGCVTGLSEGKVTITAKTENSGVYSKKKLTVYENKIKFLKLSEKEAVIGLQDTKKLTLEKTPDFVTNDQVIWTSSDTSVASVNANGVVTGRKKGKAVIKAMAVSNKQAVVQCKVIVSENKGQITKQMLDKLNLKDVDNLMIVAHPDDETLWGGGHLIQGNYLVVCLTNGDDSVRRREFMNVVEVSQDKGLILSYPDLIDKRKGSGIENRSTWEYEQLAIRKDIGTLLKYKKWNIVVTHNPDGEYGHQHHRYTSRHVTDMYKLQPECAKNFMYFGKYYSKGKMTQSVKATLPVLPENVYKQKKKLMDQYQSKLATLYEVYYHMTPYEDWIPYQNWK